MVEKKKAMEMDQRNISSERSAKGGKQYPYRVHYSIGSIVH